MTMNNYGTPWIVREAEPEEKDNGHSAPVFLVYVHPGSHPGWQALPWRLFHVDTEYTAYSPETVKARLDYMVRAVNAHQELVDALEALTDPEGHIWHGGNDECTGECKAVRAALITAHGGAPGGWK